MIGTIQVSTKGRQWHDITMVATSHLPSLMAHWGHPSRDWHCWIFHQHLGAQSCLFRIIIPFKMGLHISFGFRSKNLIIIYHTLIYWCGAMHKVPSSSCEYHIRYENQFQAWEIPAMLHGTSKPYFYLGVLQKEWRLVWLSIQSNFFSRLANHSNHLQPGLSRKLWSLK